MQLARCAAPVLATSAAPTKPYSLQHHPALKPSLTCMTEVVPRASLQARSSSSVGSRHLRSYNSSQAILSLPSALLLAGPSAAGAAAGSLVGLPLELLPAKIKGNTVRSGLQRALFLQIVAFDVGILAVHAFSIYKARACGCRALLQRLQEICSACSSNHTGPTVCAWPVHAVTTSATDGGFVRHYLAAAQPGLPPGGSLGRQST